jgi:hypothetical protein
MFETDIYTDIRESNPSEGLRSINLAISHRGIAALQAIDPGVTDRFLKTVIPVHARMIHYVDGGLKSQPYDRHGQVKLSLLAVFSYALMRYFRQSILSIARF